MSQYPKEFLELCHSVTAKRPKTVIKHILEHGSITTEDLKDLYGYNHPPRAARDVREHGIPLETFKVEAKDGRKIGAYRFGDPSKIRLKRFDGRTALSKDIKEKLIEKYGCKCFIYLEEMEKKLLQIDHRVPYEVGGDNEKSATLNPDDFMLLCGSANRAKSWSCEHCDNWNKYKKTEICLSCYWAYPEKYDHVAMRQIRRLDLIWEESDVSNYDKLKKDASGCGVSLPEFVKDILTKHSSK
jgi:hypothetical protein